MKESLQIKKGLITLNNPIIHRVFTILLLLLILASCSESPNAQPSYEEVKKIVLDAIQTEDGKKAIRQLLEDPNFRELVILEHEEVKTAINDTLMSEQAEEFWKKTFEDPKFKETIAKSMKEQQKEIMKQLMKDSSYQQDLIAFFGQPEMKKELESILKSAEMRKEMETVVMETIENPLLQTKWQELIKKSGEAGSKGGGKEGEGKKEENSSEDQ